MHSDLSLQSEGIIKILLIGITIARETIAPLAIKKTTLLIAVLDWRYCQIAVLEAVIDSIQWFNDRR